MARMILIQETTLDALLEQASGQLAVRKWEGEHGKDTIDLMHSTFQHHMRELIRKIKEAAIE